MCVCVCLFTVQVDFIMPQFYNGVTRFVSPFSCGVFRRSSVVMVMVFVSNIWLASFAIAPSPPSPPLPRLEVQTKCIVLCPPHHSPVTNFAKANKLFTSLKTNVFKGMREMMLARVFACQNRRVH